IRPPRPGGMRGLRQADPGRAPRCRAGGRPVHGLPGRAGARLVSVTLETPQLVSIGLAFAGFLLGFGRILLAQIDRRLEQRFGAIERQGDEWRRLERDVLTLKADLPVHYVRREDYVRGQSTIEAK